MSFELECNRLVQEYLKEVKNQDLTIEEIYERPHWKRVYFWWKALEHYEGKPMPDFTIEEIKDIYGK